MQTNETENSYSTAWQADCLVFVDKNDFEYTNYSKLRVVQDS